MNKIVDPELTIDVCIEKLKLHAVDAIFTLDEEKMRLLRKTVRYLEELKTYRDTPKPRTTHVGGLVLGEVVSGE